MKKDNKAQKPRIWELDALRGLCILCMIVIHFFFDLDFFGGMELSLPHWFLFLRQYGHVFFVLISGICATLASKSFQRGIYVFGCGLLVSYATLFAEVFLSLSGVRIWFGVLHMLGLCMILYPLFKKFPFWLLALIGLAFVVLGFWMETLTVSARWLFPMGLCSEDIYVGSDYFPLFPGFGWFLIGAALGKSIYRKKQSLLPRIHGTALPLRFLRFIGKHSLPFYLLHQPVLMAVTYLICL